MMTPPKDQDPKSRPPGQGGLALLFWGVIGFVGSQMLFSGNSVVEKAPVIKAPVTTPEVVPETSLGSEQFRPDRARPERRERLYRDFHSAQLFESDLGAHPVITAAPNMMSKRIEKNLALADAVLAGKMTKQELDQELAKLHAMQAAELAAASNIPPSNMPLPATAAIPAIPATVAAAAAPKNAVDPATAKELANIESLMASRKALQGIDQAQIPKGDPTAIEALKTQNLQSLKNNGLVPKEFLSFSEPQVTSASGKDVKDSKAANGTSGPLQANREAAAPAPLSLSQQVQGERLQSYVTSHEGAAKTAPAQKGSAGQASVTQVAAQTASQAVAPPASTESDLMRSRGSRPTERPDRMSH